MTYKIKINGKQYEDTNSETINEKLLVDLIKELGFRLGQVAVKVNGIHVKMRDYNSYTLNSEDNIDIITLIAGG